MEGRGKNEHWFFTFSNSINYPHGRGNQPVNSSRGFQNLHNNTYMYQNLIYTAIHTFLWNICLCVSHLYCPQLALKLWHSFDLLPNFCQTSGHKFFVKHWATTHLKMKISCLLHTDELTYISYMKLWDFEGKFSACLRIKEKHTQGAERRKSYLSPISISLRPSTFGILVHIYGVECVGAVPWFEGSSVVYPKWWQLSERWWSWR